MGERAQEGSDDDGGCRLPQVEAKKDDRDDPDEDSRELEVRREPGPEQVDGLAVPLLEGDVLDAARLDGGDPLAVLALPDRYVLLYFLSRLLSPSP